jgi:hypothetical protein
MEESRMVSAIDPTKPRDGVPAKKSDLRGNLQAAKAEIEELQLRKIENGMPLDMGGEYLHRSVLVGHSELTERPIIDRGQVTLDLGRGSVFEIFLTEDVNYLFLPNMPTNQAAGIVIVLIQDDRGGWSFAWPNVVMWSGGLAPTMSKTPNARDVYSLLTTNGGTGWFGFVGGLAFR